jgi:hypothetical protein
MVGVFYGLSSRAFFFERNGMWKIAVAFAIFAGLALYILSKGGDIDMGGEKHGADAMHSEPAKAAPAPAAPASAQK